jgi:hypothetical protein
MFESAIPPRRERHHVRNGVLLTIALRRQRTVSSKISYAGSELATKMKFLYITSRVADARQNLWQDLKSIYTCT